MRPAPGAAPAAGLGHNLPALPDQATIEELLSADHRKLIDRIDEIDATIEFRLPQEITDEEQAKKLATFANICRSAEKAIAPARKEALAPYEVPVNVVKAFFGKLQERIKAANERVNQLAQEWDRKVREAARKRADELAKAHQDNARAAPPPPPPPAQTTVKSDQGAAMYQTASYHPKIVDAAAVPRQFCRPDEQLIKAAWKADPALLIVDEITKAAKTTIPGVEVETKWATTVRGS